VSALGTLSTVLLPSIHKLLHLVAQHALHHFATVRRRHLLQGLAHVLVLHRHPGCTQAEPLKGGGREEIGEGGQRVELRVTVKGPWELGHFVEAGQQQLQLQRHCRDTKSVPTACWLREGLGRERDSRSSLGARAQGHLCCGVGRRQAGRCPPLHWGRRVLPRHCCVGHHRDEPIYVTPQVPAPSQTYSTGGNKGGRGIPPQ